MRPHIKILPRHRDSLCPRLWWCYTDDAQGLGHTPEGAYSAWRECLERNGSTD